jgi:hypothetical protein
MANMNRSRKRHQQGRKVPSHLRTLGRLNRYFSRHPQPRSGGVPDTILDIKDRGEPQ